MLKVACLGDIVRRPIAMRVAGRGARHIMTEGERKKSGGNNRAARLEAELRANLKKRKEQARARSRTAQAGQSECGVGGAAANENAE